MRKVDRTSVPMPARLKNLTEVNRGHLTDPRKISNSVYGHDDVKQSLQMLYFDKCYICEGDISSGGYDVEHYLPKEKFPHLGYTWDNLHKSCSGCNSAKKIKHFFIEDATGKTTDIKLLDPSSSKYDIAEYLTFDINSLAEEIAAGKEEGVRDKAQNTVFYLNGGYPSDYGKTLSYLRANKANHFMRFCRERFSRYEDRIITIKLNIDSYSKPKNTQLLLIDESICQGLINAENEYLAGKVPFSTATRVQLYPILKINYKQLINMKNKMKNILDL